MARPHEATRKSNGVSTRGRPHQSSTVHTNTSTKIVGLPHEDVRKKTDQSSTKTTGVQAMSSTQVVGSPTKKALQRRWVFTRGHPQEILGIHTRMPTSGDHARPSTRVVRRLCEDPKLADGNRSVTFLYNLNGFSHTSLARVSRTLESLESLYGIGSVAFLYSLNELSHTSLARISRALAIS